jgi:hypothetical protein
MNSNTVKSLTASLVAALFFAGCSLGSSSANLSNMTTPPKGDVPPAVVPPEDLPPPSIVPPPQEIPPVDPIIPARCDMGKTYTGFAGTELTAGRIDGDIGPERARMKPFSALTGEFPRVLANTPAMLADPSVGNTYSITPARWVSEPVASGVTVYTTYRIAFQGCLTATGTPAQYKTLPSNTTAATECGDWARKFWSRTATQAEVNACVKVAMVDTATETNSMRRWAYTCASVMTAAGFTTY